MNKVEEVFQRNRDLLKRLKNLAASEPQKKNFDKLSAKVQAEIDDYFKLKNKYDFLCNEKNAASPANGANGTDSGAGSFVERDSDVPIMKAYDQVEFVEKRQEQIKKLNQDARDVNQLAIDINGKIYEQGDKLDEVNKKMVKQVEEVKVANHELKQAKEISAKRNKNMMCWVLFITVLSAILVLSIYFLFK